ncbi:A disintegrin and metalloproteinase with like protein [Argiope bruennichi]|uniref:A disintegrin and metalloproteinase with like protein n=1 Tax=Argiope bruennichi TaxID=94029 RepID=A0A8T0EJ29_ARGBR|nr:A disintegrin and metalloproteinase with like protein [Argiope bruennichi]
MKHTKHILSFLLIHFIMASCFPQSFDIHKRLNKDQLKKYFSVHNYDEVPEYKFVKIRMRKSGSVPNEYPSSHEISYRTPAEQGQDLYITTESVFGHTVQMQLLKNNRLLAPSFKAIRIEGEGSPEQEMDTSYFPVCHYIGSNGSFAAAVSSCSSSSLKGLSGLLMLPDGSVQIQPVDQDLAEILGISLLPDKRSNHHEEDLLHLVFKPSNQKRLSVPDEKWEDEQYIPSPRSEYELDDDDIMVRSLDFDDMKTESDESLNEMPPEKEEKTKRQESYAKGKNLYLELAVFFDQKGYEMFQPHVKSEEQLVDLILGFVNQMQALYQQPSLKKKIQISIVRLEVMKKQPSDLPHADGDRDKLLDSFCAYQAKKNPDSDSDPNHWDLALYISGLNFYAMEKGKKNGITMGLAPVGGVCLKKHACVITEFGTTSDDGRPYPSAGLLSTYIAAHEIGHNLGMYHDGPPNNKCPSNGHVMSPSRGTKGETTWSKCSSEVLEKSDKKCLFDEPQGTPSKDQDHEKFKEKPGQVWDAHDQCKIFLRDEDATVFNETVFSSVCHETLCKTPRRIGYYAAGPALEGTFCGGKKWCKNGECVSWGSEKIKVVKGGWSDWTKGECKSGCIKKSRAVTVDKRYCSNPKPQNTEKYCEGDNIRVHFCDDSKLCKNYVPPVDYAKQRCEFFSKYVPDITPVGVQVKYNEKRQWQSCAVYCKMKTGTWYTPRQEFNDRGIDTFFPDGTWCHSDGRTDYFCQNRLCLPPPVKGRALLPGGYIPRGLDPEVDVPVLNNAHPKGENRAPDKLREYFQYNEGRLPPLPGPDDLGRPKEEDYEIIDYVSPSL